VYPIDTAAEICDRAHEAGLKVHLDGARIFNAATYLGQPVAAITRNFDSVQFCLSKGLGAPVGSMIVGKREFIERCRVIRKMLGGGMRQVGVLAAAGMVALEEGPKNLPVDHENAQILARGLAETPGVQLDLAKVQTNIVIFDTSKTTVSPAVLVDKLAERGVLGGAIDQARVRLVTHRDVSRNDCERAVSILREVLGAGF
jgi:threonine aldolase